MSRRRREEGMWNEFCGNICSSPRISLGFPSRKSRAADCFHSSRKVVVLKAVLLIASVFTFWRELKRYNKFSSCSATTGGKAKAASSTIVRTSWTSDWLLSIRCGTTRCIFGFLLLVVRLDCVIWIIKLTTFIACR